MLQVFNCDIIGERERANLVVRLARVFCLYIISNFRAHGHRGYPLFADTLHTCSIHKRNVKYKGQQLFRHDNTRRMQALVASSANLPVVYNVHEAGQVKGYPQTPDIRGARVPEN